MFFFKRKKEHDIDTQIIKTDIEERLDKATKEVVKNRRKIQANGITLEIKKALGGHHV